MENEDVEDGRWIDPRDPDIGPFAWGCAGVGIVFMVILIIGIIQLCLS